MISQKTILIVTILMALATLHFCTSGMQMKEQETQTLNRNQKPSAGPAPEIKLPEIQERTLPNGLEIRLVEHYELPVVNLRLLVHAGSAEDPLDMPGLANMTAEMLDEGTKNRDVLTISEDIEFLGANLSTGSNWDYSYANLTTLTKHLTKALDVYSDVILNATFAENEFERVQEQRLNSILQKKDNPQQTATEVFYRVIYTDNHPYGNPSEGTEESVKGMTREDLQTFWKQYYNPGNATLIVVGNITMDELVEKIQPTLGNWSTRGKDFTGVEEIPEADFNNTYLVDKPGAPQSQIRIGHPGLHRNNPDYPGVQVMNEILGGAFGSRINMNLREDKGYTYGARSLFVYRRGKGPFLAYAGVKTSTTDSAVVEFMKEINSVIDEQVTRQELDKAKSSMTLSLARELETPDQIMGMVVDQVVYNLPDGYLNNYVENVRNITLSDVRNAARKYLHPENMAILIVGDIETIKPGLKALGYGDIIELDVNGNPVSS